MSAIGPYNILGKSDYTPSADLPTKVLGWCGEALQESDYYLKTQKGYGRSKELQRMIMGDDRAWGDGELSKTSDNEMGRLFSVFSADLTDFRPYWQYESFNPAHEQQVRIQSNILTSWFPKYGERPTERIVKNAILAGSSVGNLSWDRNRQDISLSSRPIHDVRPVRPFGDTGSYQDCFAVIDQREMPVNYVREMFPHAAPWIVAERDASMAALLSTAGNRVFRGTPLTTNTPIVSAPAARLGALPVLDLFYLYVDDRSVNEDDWAVEMGDWGDAEADRSKRVPLNDWSYKVEPGDPLYPLKRLIIWTRTVILYDGPSNYWHGMFPYAKLVLDTIPDSWLGVSPMWRCMPLQRSLDKAYRAVDNHIAKILEPGKQAPKLGTALAEINKFRTNLPGQSHRYGPGGKIEVEEIPDLDPFVERYMDRLLNRMQQHVGVQQLMSLATLGQIPEGDTVEKLLYSLQPEIRARSRSIEAFQREIGVMFAYDVAQFYPVGRRVQILGEDGRMLEDYDIDKYSLIPAHVGSDFGPDGRVLSHRLNNPRPRFDRAREFYREFGLNIQPASMLSSAETQKKLMTLTLRRQGDMPLRSMLKTLGYQNLGPEPKESLIDQITMEKAGLPPAGSTMSAELMQAAQMVMANPQIVQMITAIQQQMAGSGSAPGQSSTPGNGAGSGGGMPFGAPGTGSSGATEQGFGAQRGPGHPPSGDEMPHQRNDGRIEESS